MNEVQVKPQKQYVKEVGVEMEDELIMIGHYFGEFIAHGPRSKPAEIVVSVNGVPILTKLIPQNEFISNIQKAGVKPVAPFRYKGSKSHIYKKKDLEKVHKAMLKTILSV